MTAANADLVRIDERGAVVHLSLRREPVNALHPALVEALLEALAKTSGASALVLGSDVPGFFAAGADLKYMANLDNTGFTRYRDLLRSLMETLSSCASPTIAAIDGRAIGGGVELALACTLRIATPRSRFGLPELGLGLIPGAGATQRLPSLIGRSAALQMMLSGDEVDGLTAARLGLVSALSEEDPTTCAIDLAQRIAQYPRAAVHALLRCTDAGSRPATDGMALEASEVERLFREGHADAHLRSFLQRRRSSHVHGANEAQRSSLRASWVRAVRS